MASCSGNESRIAVEGGDAKLDGVPGEGEPEVEMRGGGGEPAGAADDERGIVDLAVEEPGPDLLGFVARRFLEILLGEFGEQRVERIVRELEADEGARRVAKERPEIDLQPALHRRGEVAVEAEVEHRREEEKESRAARDQDEVGSGREGGVDGDGCFGPWGCREMK